MLYLLNIHMDCFAVATVLLWIDAYLSLGCVSMFNVASSQITLGFIDTISILGS